MNEPVYLSGSLFENCALSYNVCSEFDHQLFKHVNGRTGRNHIVNKRYLFSFYIRPVSSIDDKFFSVLGSVAPRELYFRRNHIISDGFLQDDVSFVMKTFCHVMHEAETVCSRANKTIRIDMIAAKAPFQFLSGFFGEFHISDNCKRSNLFICTDKSKRKLSFNAMEINCEVLHTYFFIPRFLTTVHTCILWQPFFLYPIRQLNIFSSFCLMRWYTTQDLTRSQDILLRGARLFH